LGAALVFPIVFGLFDALIMMWAFWLWVGVSAVAADRDTVSISRGLFLPSKTTRYASRTIRDVVVTVGMQSGSTPYYRIVLIDEGGKKIQVGWGIRDKREAEWIGQRLRQAIGLDDAASSSTSRSGIRSSPQPV
jgi:hypothetical protein